MDLPQEVTLRGSRGELKIRIVVPASMALRHEVAYASTSSPDRAFGAALGLCSAAIQKHVKWRFNVLEFGGQVLDWLLESGVSYIEAREAARIAWLHVVDGLVAQREVDETEGFTEPPVEGSGG